MPFVRLEGTLLQGKNKLRESNIEPFNMAAATCSAQFAEAKQNKVLENTQKFFRNVKEQTEGVLKNVTGKDVNLDIVTPVVSAITGNVDKSEGMPRDSSSSNIGGSDVDKKKGFWRAVMPFGSSPKGKDDEQTAAPTIEDEQRIAYEARLAAERFEAELERAKKERKWEYEIERIRKERQVRLDEELVAKNSRGGAYGDGAPVVDHKACAVCIIS